MEPIVYIYQDHLQDFWNSGQSQCFGAAFEWKGEQVYHVYIKYPQVAPTGYSMPCLFRVVDTDDYGKAEDVALSVYASMPEEAKRVPVVIVCIHVEDTKVSSRAFIVDDGRIIEAVVKYVPRKSELYTRSKGLLEVGALESKKVLIVGLGSGGAPIAVELAKAGVGHFILMDFDRIELHNIARHICGVNELGRLKVNAVKDAILLKNPYAQVETYDIDMNKQLDILEKCVAESDLNNDFINSSNEFRPQEFPQGFHCPFLGNFLFCPVESNSNALVCRTSVGSHADNCICKADSSALCIVNLSFIQNLHQDIHDIRMCFFNFIEQNDRIRLSPYLFGQLSSFIITDISRRRTNHSCNRMLFHKFCHIQPNQRVIVIEQFL